MDPRIADIEKEYMRGDLPAFAPGDTVRVRVRVVEGDKERIQAFEGICIARRGAGVNETFTVRRISGGVGVERTFLVHSPIISGIEIVRRGQVRRAKLYYLRARRGKRARVRERRWWLDAAREAETAAYGAADEGGPVVPGEDEEVEVMAPEDVASPSEVEPKDDGEDDAKAVDEEDDEASRREAAAEATAE